MIKKKVWEFINFHKLLLVITIMSAYIQIFCSMSLIFDLGDDEFSSDSEIMSDSCANLFIETEIDSFEIEGAYPHFEEKCSILWGFKNNFIYSWGENNPIPSEVKNSKTILNMYLPLKEDTEVVKKEEKAILKPWKKQTREYHFLIPFETKSITVKANHYTTLLYTFPEKITRGKKYHLNITPHISLPYDRAKPWGTIIFDSDYSDNYNSFKIITPDKDLYLTKGVEEQINTGKYIITTTENYECYEWKMELEVQQNDKIELSNKFVHIDSTFVEPYKRVLPKNSTRYFYYYYHSFPFRTVIIKKNGQLILEEKLKPISRFTYYSALHSLSFFQPNTTQYRGRSQNNDIHSMLSYGQYLATKENSFLEFPGLWEIQGLNNRKDTKANNYILGILPKLRWDYKNKYAILYLVNLGYRHPLIDKHQFNSDLSCQTYYSWLTNVYNTENSNQKLRSEHNNVMFGLTLSLNNRIKIWSHYNLEVKAGYELLKSSIDKAKWYDKTAPEGQQYSDIDFSKLKVYHKSSPFVSIGIAF